MSVTTQIARKQYPCQHCRGLILIGQEYYKRMESQRVHCSTSYYPLTWHKNKSDCQPHKKTIHRTEDCKLES